MSDRSATLLSVPKYDLPTCHKPLNRHSRFAASAKKRSPNNENGNTGRLPGVGRGLGSKPRRGPNLVFLKCTFPPHELISYFVRYSSAIQCRMNVLKSSTKRMQARMLQGRLMNGTFEAAIQSRTLNLDLKDAGIGNESLSTICTDLFLITMNMTPDLDMGSEEDMRRILRYYVDRFENNCRSAGIPSEKREKVKYALVALIDEKAFTLPPQWSGPWRSHPLQFDYFGDMIAGQRFFDNLDKLMQKPQGNVDVLEVYYLCMCLGFKGKHAVDRSVLEKLIRNVARLIIKNRPPVSPTPATPSSGNGKKRGRIPHVPTWSIVVAAASLVVVMWLGAILSVGSHTNATIGRLPTEQETAR